MVPPVSAWPWLMMSMKALRSIDSAMARRMSGLLKGGASRLRIRLVLLFIDAVSQIACGACSLTSFKSGMVTA